MQSVFIVISFLELSGHNTISHHRISVVIVNFKLIENCFINLNKIKYELDININLKINKYKI